MAEYWKLEEWIEETAATLPELREAMEDFLAARGRYYTADALDRLLSETFFSVAEEWGRDLADALRAWALENPDLAKQWGYRTRYADIVERMPVYYLQGRTLREIADLEGVSYHYMWNVTWLARRVLGEAFPYWG